MAFNFKSAGTKVSSREVSTDRITKKTTDVGIKTPLSNYQERQIFDMNTDPILQIKDNLRNLLMTNFGERLGLYDFGADLNALLFDAISSESIENEAIERIEKAVQRYMPGIEIEEVSEVKIDLHEKNLVNLQGMAKIRLRIKYSIPSARIGNQFVEVTLQNGG